MDASWAIVEAEVVGIDPSTGNPVPFQELSGRIKRKHYIGAVAAEISPIDLPLRREEPLLERPLRDRLAELDKTIQETSRVGRTDNRVTDDPVEVEAFLEQVRAAGHESLMGKNLDAQYEPGSRVGYQRTLKPMLE